MPVQRGDSTACEARKYSPLPRSRVADIEAMVGEGQEQKAVAGGVDGEVMALVVIVECENRPVPWWGMPEIKGFDGGVGDFAAAPADWAMEGDERERRLEPVVREEEVSGGGEAVPAAADRTAAEKVLRRQANEDLPQELLRDAASGGAAPDPRPSSSRGLGHGLRIRS